VRILILSFSYPPVANARALRWGALAADWARQGHEVAVVAAWLPGAAEAERIDGVAVHRAGLRVGERLRARLAARRTSAVRSGGAQPGSTLLHRLWRSVYWPDTSCLWFVPALGRARKLMREMRPDAVVSVSPMFTAVMVGLRLLSGSHPPPRWLIDLGDPFSFAEEAPPNNLRLYRRLNQRMERAAFRRADAVAVTTQETRARYAALFGASAGKIEVIPPLVPIDCAPKQEAPTDVISLVYVGTLYRSIRGPDFLLALFRRLLGRPIGPRLQLHVYGDVQDCRPSFERHAELLGRRLFVHGAVPRPRALDAMQEASVLVNIGNRTSYQLPSKLVEYAALGKPILNIAAVPGDSSARFLARYPRHLSLEQSGELTEEQLTRSERFLEDAADRRLAPVPSEWVTPYRLSGISASYLALLRA
jgi:glycosyltransferase involved in cell wall biosynthesis